MDGPINSPFAKSITTEVLRQWPLPMPSDDGDKEERGRVMVIGGSREIAGAILLAAVAALRAGAGKLTVAAGASIAPHLAVAIPEARVVALPETPDGGISPCGAEILEKLIPKIDAVLIGPGMQDEPAACDFVAAMLLRLNSTKVILDACAMGIACKTEASHASFLEEGNPQTEALAAPLFLDRFCAQVLLTPHAGEMAHLTGESKEDVLSDPGATARRAAQRWGACVALKGASTFISAPDGRLWRHDGGNIGLAVSGSGDVLAGIIAGLAARGASLEQACAWGVALHARAGDQLAARIGPLGFMARDISAEVPMLMHRLLLDEQEK